MGKALYRKYRSRKLSEIVGQEHVTTLLENALKKDRVAHAYLFTGPRGVGKTSIARILAHEINDLEYSDESHHLDIIEIDAASNNGVDDIRDLREKVNLAPISAKKKIYIIDEVHMLSKAAFNALLKTLEEPPEHVVFILATTDVDKLPDTIVSRTQRHSFHLATESNIIKNLEQITAAESINISTEALRLIARHSDGSFRDSVSLLDQLANSRMDDKQIDARLVESVLGLASGDQITILLDEIKGGHFQTVITHLKDLEESGIQPRIIASQLLSVIRDKLASEPSLIKLFDELLTVTGSPFPEAKLLAVIGAYITSKDGPYEATNSHKTHTEAISVGITPIIAEVRTKNEPLPELAKKATEPHPKDNIIRSADIVPEKPEKAVLSTPKKRPKVLVQINTELLLSDAHDAGIGLHSILKQSSFVQSDDAFMVYVKNPFNKKQLSTAKNLRLLHDCIAKQSANDLIIEIIPSTKPSDNSDIAAVTAIMGGGEEVSAEGVL